MMFSKTERMLAFRYLKSRKRTGFVSVIAGFSFLGIMLGVATLIIVMSVMNGFREELMNRVLGINGQLGVYPAWGSTLDAVQDKVDKMQKIDGVVQAIPVVDGQVMVSSKETSAGVMVRGMTAEDFAKRPLLGGQYKGWELSEFTDGQVILGYRLARKLAVRSGDDITLVSPKGNVTAFGTLPKMKAYTVIGTFNSGMSEYDSNFIFMPLTEAQKFFMMKDKVSHLEVFTQKDADMKKIIDEAFVAMGDTAQIHDWRYTNKAFFNAIEVERNVMFLILTLIIVVAAFNMISGLIMLVKDKAKDIAVLRTMGMSRGAVQRIFLMSGLTVGVVGTLAGFVLGLAFCYNIDSIKNALENLSGKELFSAEIYFLSKLPAKVDMTEVGVVVCMSLVLALLSTIYPSYKASKTDPVEALRYE
ncbi:MAG: lipoprotein-releasing ABC transporter permease subunit [Alphaproteobacteria bacterium]|nr:lipoprotein-releasing ABC transporter permease subunit [Alphaproteobacteria bacterium]